MRAYLPEYEMRIPADLNEALTLMSQSGQWRPFAGGTDLMVELESGKLLHKKYVSIWGLSELKGIEVGGSHIKLGALTTFTRVQAHPVLQSEFPMLCQAAAETGALAIQNRGTLGGNIANASPAADSPPALLAYDADVELVSKQGARWIPYREFHTGYKTTVIRYDEILKSIRLSRGTASTRQYYRKVGTRKAQAISKVCFAARVQDMDGRLSGVRIALGSVAPTPVRCLKTEAVLEGRTLSPELVAQARQAIAQEISPIDDVRSTAKFRKKVTQNLLEEFLCGIGSQS